MNLSVTFLIDHNLSGYAVLLWGTLAESGWLDLIELHFVFFEDVGLPANTNDRIIWRFVQEKQWLLLTANRNMKGKDSLEQTMRQESTPVSLPVITIANRDRLTERSYRELCVDRLVEIALDLEACLGASRLFIP